MLNPRSLTQADSFANAATVSSEYERMRADWELISDILGGVRWIRSEHTRRTRYLPKFEDETPNEYARRALSTPWRPEFADALRSIADKPFGKDVSLKDGAPDSVKDLVEDVDARGNSLTVFAREAFTKAVANGLHAILVDYPDLMPGEVRTIADEREAGVRPYWVQVPASHLIALYTEIVGGRERVAHARIREFSTERDGFGEVRIERIRVLEPGRWELWERQGTNDLTKVAEGAINRNGKTDVPIALFYAGERHGDLFVKPPLIDLAHMQIELYQALSRLEEVLTYAGFPMLAAVGMAKPKDAVVAVGPKQVLFAPPGGDGNKPDFKFVQPDAANIKELRDHVGSIVADMRRLGMQPLVENAGRNTATGAAIDAAKSHTSVKAWAVGLKDALEQAMVFTAEWMGIETDIELSVWTDFNVLPYAKMPLDALATARAEGDLSRRSYWEGLQRFDALPADFDADAEEAALKEEKASEPPPVPAPAITLDPATRLPVPKVPTPVPTPPPAS